MEVQTSLEPFGIIEDKFSGAKIARSDSGLAVPGQVSTVPSPVRPRKVVGSSSHTSRPAYKLQFEKDRQ